MSDYNRRMTWADIEYEQVGNSYKEKSRTQRHGRFRHWGTYRNEDGVSGICAVIELDDGTPVERPVEGVQGLRFLRDDEPGPPAPAPKMSVSARNGAD